MFPNLRVSTSSQKGAINGTLEKKENLRGKGLIKRNLKERIPFVFTWKEERMMNHLELYEVG